MTGDRLDSFGSRGTLTVGPAEYEIHRLGGLPGVERLPYSLKVLLENLLRHEDGERVTRAQIEALLGWDPAAEPSVEIEFTPARVLLQDFTGVPCVVDLVGMRDAMAARGGPVAGINPQVPVDLVIDHSVIADAFGARTAFEHNARLEFERNQERYALLRWAQQAFDNVRVVPPDTGICHQVNLEYLAPVVFTAERDGRTLAYPDTLVGTDSHTPMINGLGVLGWGVGGIEAEAAMLGQPVSMLIPRVVGLKLTGALRPGATATDLVLTVAELLRRTGVVGKFVEFYGPGVANVPLADRATLGNMSPEYGSTVSIFPIDDVTLDYLRLTGRPADRVALVEAYAREQGLWHDPDAEPAFTQTVELDLASVEPSIAGPKRPQDRIPLVGARSAVARYLTQGRESATSEVEEGGEESFPASDPLAVTSAVRRRRARGDGVPGQPHTPDADADVPPWPSDPAAVVLADGTAATLDQGDVVIAAITSCTNTSNPSVMVAAGLLAKKAVERGLRSRPWVKTTLAPGSRVVTDYLDEAGLTPYLEQLGFHLVGYGCTTCIGNSGPLIPEVSAAVTEHQLSVCSVLSGNRNFEGRIHPETELNFLASPPLVVAYALAGTLDIDLQIDPLGEDAGGRPVTLADLWPSAAEIDEIVDAHVREGMFRAAYDAVYDGDDRWRSLPVPDGEVFAWDERSSYVRRPPFYDDLPDAPADLTDIEDARVLALLGDSVTTDHISPAGAIPRESPAGRYLRDLGVEPADFNSYGARRGNHEVMMRGTFANIRIRNKLAGDVQGGVTRLLLDGAPAEPVSIYDAAMAYRERGVPLLVIAGAEYGSGSSRDWAAKGTLLLGVRAVLAESFERIHRSNLVGMGVLPLQFRPGETAESLGLTGEETFTVRGLAGRSTAPESVTIEASGAAGVITFGADVRIDTPVEHEYYRHGGILPFMLRQLRGGS